MGDGDNQRKVIASNRKARYEYEIIDTFEAGMVLLGPRGEIAAGREGEPRRRLRGNSTRRTLPA